jgi:hypothetical protein
MIIENKGYNTQSPEAGDIIKQLDCEKKQVSCLCDFR